MIEALVHVATSGFAMTRCPYIRRRIRKYQEIIERMQVRSESAWLARNFSPSRFLCQKMIYVCVRCHWCACEQSVKWICAQVHTIKQLQHETRARRSLWLRRRRWTCRQVSQKQNKKSEELAHNWREKINKQKQHTFDHERNLPGWACAWLQPGPCTCTLGAGRCWPAAGCAAACCPSSCCSSACTSAGMSISAAMGSAKTQSAKNKTPLNRGQQLYPFASLLWERYYPLYPFQVVVC